MPLADNPAHVTWFVRLATFALVVAILRAAEDVLLPMAFAALLAFLLTPLVVRLTSWGLPRTLAIILTVTVAFAVLGGIGWIVTNQAISLVRELPDYEENLRVKIAALKKPNTTPTVSRMAGMVDNLRRELQTPDSSAITPSPSGEDQAKPVPVEVRSSALKPWEVAREIVTPVLRPLGIAGIVVVFVVAMLFQREDLRDRFVKLVSAGKINVATRAIDDAGGRVSRYLVMQLVVNATYGFPIAIGLYFIGIPNALLWGLLATLLRFIPFVGPWIAACFPVALSVAVDPGWTMLLYTIALFAVMELISNNVVEIILYGASTGISNLALLVAAVFWTWLWGPAGLVLSTPLTVCVLVLGNYVPGMSFLSMLLGSEPVLEPPAQFYQRMLSMESEEMFELAEKYIADHSLEDFYERVFVPALLMAEEDRHSGNLTEARQRFIVESSRELIDELERLDEAAANAAPTAAAAPVIIGLPARDEADELVALAVVHLLHRRGVAAKLHPLGAPLDETIAALADGRLRGVFVSALPPSAVTAARQVYRRMRSRTGEPKMLIGIWQPTVDPVELNARLHPAANDLVATSLLTAVDALTEMAGNPARAAEASVAAA